MVRGNWLKPVPMGYLKAVLYHTKLGIGSNSAPPTNGGRSEGLGGLL